MLNKFAGVWYKYIFLGTSDQIVTGSEKKSKIYDNFRELHGKYNLSCNIVQVANGSKSLQKNIFSKTRALRENGRDFL